MHAIKIYMRETSPFSQSFEQLPNTLPIFPLGGAIVLPGGALALNIFETRYLNMVQDAIKSDQLIGMIQPQDESTPATLHDIGCAARIVRYRETKDGRLEISLEGLCRFGIHEELSCMRGYRLVKPSWLHYQHDFSVQDQADPHHFVQFINALHNYFSNQDIEIDWATLEQASQETLVNNLVGRVALSNEDKQLLIEATSLSDRVKSFTAILTDRESGLTTRH